MKYAVIMLAGRQFTVKEGDTLQVTRQASDTHKTLFYNDGTNTKVGTPFLEDIAVNLEKIEDKNDKKVVVARFRAKSRHRVKRGHRQPVSVYKVTSIGEVNKEHK